jgi:glutamate synthase domain-containing protein 3
LAKNIINSWENNLKFFKKIMPIDYKKVLVQNESNNNKIVA